MCRSANAGYGDRRRSFRFDAPGTWAACRGKSFYAWYIVDNLSLGGAMLLGEPSPELAETVDLVIFAPERSPIKARACVVRQRQGGGGFAVEFDRVEETAKDTIHDMLVAALIKREAETVRAHERVSTPGAEAICEQGATAAIYELIHLSPNGALINGEPPLRTGHFVEITIVTKRHATRVQGRVLRQDRTGDTWTIGVGFSHLRRRAKQTFEDIFREYATLRLVPPLSADLGQPRELR